LPRQRRGKNNIMMEMSPERKTKLYRGLKIALIVFLAVVVANCFFGFRNYDRYGNKIENTIVITGHGEISAVPDIANIYFTITKDDKTVKNAQAGVAAIEGKALALLEAKGIEKKDIKTTNASFNPKYEYRQAVCPPIPMGAGTAGVTVNPASPYYYCPPSKQVITGYTASENITVKIRKTDSVGDIMQGLGTTGVSDLNGPNFTIDNEDSLKAQARKIAIDDAQAKAKVLAKDLGIRLGKMTSFNEGGNYPTPMYDKAMMSASSASPTPAVIPTGENLITSDVTITYEIR